MKKIIVFLSILVYGIFLLKTVKSDKVVPLEKTADPKNVYYYLTAINPEEFYPEYSYEMPFVDTPLTSRKYFFVLFKEGQNYHPNKNIFYAGKRVSELEKWGGTIEVIGGKKSFDELRRWWKNSEDWFSSLSKKSVYNSWEASLARYFDHVDAHIRIIENTTAAAGFLNTNDAASLARLYAFLSQHQSKINNTINNLPKSKNERTYLFRLNHEVFSALYHKIFEYTGEFNPSIITFYLSDLFQDKQFGTYAVSVEPSKSRGSVSAQNYTVFFNDKIVESSFKIDPTSPSKLQVKINSLETISTSDWKYVKREDGVYQYIFELPDSVSTTASFIHFSARSLEPATFAVQLKNTKTQNWQDEQSIFLYPHSGTIESKILLRLPSKTIGQPIRLALLSQVPVNIESIKAIIQPITIPSVILKKTDGANQAAITTENTASKPSVTKQIAALTVLIGFLFLVYQSSRLFRFFKITGTNLIIGLLSLSRKVRNIALVLSLILVVADFLFLQKSSEVIIILFSIFWLLSTIGFRDKAEVHFLLSGLLMLFYPLFFVVLPNRELAEKTVVWAFVFAIFGVIHLLYEVEQRMDDQYNFSDISNNLKSIKMGKTMMGYLVRVVSKIHKILIVFLSFFFNLSPKTRKDKFINIVKIAIIMGIIPLAQLLYQAWKEKQVWLSRQAKIELIEPRIVYHAQKVIVKGQGFDWQQNIKVKLMSQYGEVTTDMWTDDKIIFTIPLHFQSGMMTMWIEKPMQWKGKNIIVKSNIVSLKILPTTAYFGADDEEFFEQLKTLSLEALSINGYAVTK